MDNIYIESLLEIQIHGRDVRIWIEGELTQEMEHDLYKLVRSNDTIVSESLAKVIINEDKINAVQVSEYTVRGRRGLVIYKNWP